MIAPSAVDAFLRRPLPNFAAAESWTAEEVRQQIQMRVRSPVQMITKPYHHQWACWLLAVTQPELLLLLDMGLGKTKIMLDAFRHRRQVGEVKRMLVLVPTVSLLETWRLEVKKHAPDCRLTLLQGGERLLLAMEPKVEILVATYMGWLSLACDTVETDEGKKEWQIEPSRLAAMVRGFGMVVYDEITALKNHRSLLFKMAKGMMSIPYRYGLTGTPFGRNVQDLWAEFYAVDGGRALGRTLGIFRAAFFREHVNYWGGYEYDFREKRSADLRRLMAARSIRFRAQDCLNLPKRIDVRQPIIFADETWEYYRALLEQFRTKGGFEEIKNIYIKMRKLASGFLSSARVNGKQQHVRLMPNPKLDALLAAVRGLPEGAKAVVFNEFIYSGDWIEEVLGRAKIGCARLYSGTKDKAEALRRFEKAPACRVLVVNSQSGALGLNLQHARYVFFYESPVDPIIRQQAEARCHRPGQKYSVVYTDLYIKASIEEKILAYLAQGKNLFNCLVDGSATL